MRLMILLAARMGLRRSEIARVHGRDIIEDLGGLSLIVQGKGRKERIIPIIDGALAYRLRGLDGWLFPNGYGGPLSGDRVGHLMAAALPDGWTAHTLRPRFATVTYRATRDILTVQMLLGHASPATTQVYVQLDRDAARAALSAAL